MAPQRWTSPEQLEFLNSRRDAFIQARKNTAASDIKLQGFWKDLDRDWFQRWPEPAAELDTREAIEARGVLITQKKKQLRTWFNNHNGNKGRKKLAIALPTCLQRKRRRFKAVEIYSQKYYKLLVRDKVRAEIKASGLNRKQTLSVIKRLTLESFEEAPADIKSAIIKEAEAQENVNDDKYAEDDTSTPESYATAIEGLSGFITDIFEELQAKTGWNFTVLMGGPDPVNGGKNRTMSLHVGQNDVGLSFGQVHPSYQLTFLKPYATFIKQCFSSSVQASRAIIYKTDNDDSDETPTTQADVHALAITFENDGTPVVEDVDPNIPPDIPDNLETMDSTPEPQGVSEFTHPLIPDIFDMSVIDPSLRYPPTTPSRAPLSLVVPLSASLHPPATPPLSSALLPDTPHPTTRSGTPLVIPPAPITPPLAMPSPPPAMPSPPLATPSPPLAVPSTPLAVPSPSLTMPSPPLATPSPPLAMPSPPRAIPSPPPTVPFPLPPAAPPLASPRPTLLPPAPPKKKARAEKENHSNSDLNATIGQRSRRPAATKEIVPLTDPSRNASKEPEWLTRIHTFLTDSSRGSSWDSCVEAWLHFELTLCTDAMSSVRLPDSKARPSILSDWLRKRDFDHLPVIACPKVYGAEWLAWWNALQPAWRKSNSTDGLPQPLKLQGNRTIKNLLRGGPNGLMTVILGLKLWQPAPSDTTMWLRATEDLQECFETLASGGIKRKSLTDHDSNPTAKKQKNH